MLVVSWGNQILGSRALTGRSQKVAEKVGKGPDWKTDFRKGVYMEAEKTRTPEEQEIEKYTQGAVEYLRFIMSKGQEPQEENFDAPC